MSAAIRMNFRGCLKRNSHLLRQEFRDLFTLGHDALMYVYKKRCRPRRCIFTTIRPTTASKQWKNNDQGLHRGGADSVAVLTIVWLSGVVVW